MFLAVKEMRRAKVRFGLLISAITEGIAESGWIGQGTFTVDVNDEVEGSDAAIIGYTDPRLGAPDQLAEGRVARGPGEAVGSSAGFELGDKVRVLGPGGQNEGTETMIVVGLADNAQLQVTPTLFTGWDDYVASVKSANPDAGGVLPSVIAAAPVEGLEPALLAERINDASEDADALTKQAAADKSPGVAEVRQSFQVIFLLFGLVVPLVTGLFFLIITLQKSASLTLLRAIGAQSGLLIRSLMVQVLLVVGGGLLVGIALYTPLSQAELGEIQLSFDVGAVLVWSVLLLGLGLLSAIVSARRVLRTDPIEATTGEGGR